MSGGLETPTMTKVIGVIIYLQTIFTYAGAKDITLLEPQSTIMAQIGEELRIICPGNKCNNPVFTWASLSDTPLSGTTNNIGQMSVLTMKIVSENLDSYDSYRCTVRCDNPPAEKGFKVVVYSFPQPILSVSSRIAEKQSHITCNISDAYPFYMFHVRMFIGETEVAEYEYPDVNDDMHSVKNISLSHDLILTDKYEGQEIKCEAKLNFQENDIHPINRNTSVHLSLLYPPGEPTINVSPDKYVNAGETILMYCIYESRSQASVQWVKLDREKVLQMPSNDQGILTIPNAKPEHSGKYSCRVRNYVGETASQVEITVQALPEKPTLTIYPTTTVKVGQSVTIECLASGNKKMNITLWKVLEDGDTPLLEANGKLVIKEADPIDAAVYKCTAENDYGVSEASESLTVEYPPMETALTSSDEEVNEGDEVTLTCASKGVPEPSFFLYHLLPSGDSILLSEGPKVTLTNVTSAVYQCEAKNLLGSNKEKLELRVRFPPRNTLLTVTPSLAMKGGESVQIHCTSEAYPTPKLVLKKKTEMGLTELETENGHYSITHVTEEHAGIYICESSNVVGQQEAKTNVTVQVPPKNTVLTISPSSVLNEGEIGFIKCISEAVPAPRLVLKKKTEAGLIELEAEIGEYTIPNVGVEHEGTYVCESTSEAGQQIAEATLIVQAPPRNTFINITPSAVVREGEDVQIQCISEAYPSPSLLLMMKTEHGLSSQLESEVGLYKITNAGEKHAGTYICESTNVVGQQIVEAILTVQIPPRNTTVVTSSQNITAGVTVTTITYKIIPPERQRSPRFDYVPPAIIGSVVLVTAGFIGLIAYHFKQARVQGSYSLVKALRGSV